MGSVVALPAPHVPGAKMIGQVGASEVDIPGTRVYHRPMSQPISPLWALSSAVCP